MRRKASVMGEEFVLPFETLNELLPKIRDKAHQLGLRFLWYTPTQYCRFDPEAWFGPQVLYGGEHQHVRRAERRCLSVSKLL